LVLGGYFYLGAKHVAPKKPSKFAREFSSGIKSNSQWVIRSFNADDFIKIYNVEGLAYQYWRVTALMRTVGKGAKITITAQGDWEYNDDEDFDWLIRSVDERTSSRDGARSLLGVWAPSNRKLGLHALFCPSYNVSRIKPGDAFNALGFKFHEDYVSKFLPTFVDLGTYLDSHQFLVAAFEKKADLL
jgi:hypothetical protein